MKVHLIAIGGSAMHNLAIALHCNHHTVTGSDDEIYDPARSRLLTQGLLPPQLGWHPDRIHPGLDLVILGMHARPDNPELARARDLGIRICSYPEFLYERARHQRRLVVAGSHGKTTTTAMILHALSEGGSVFDYLVGAQLEGFDNMVQLSEAPLIVIEGDEYLSSPIDRRPKFLHYRPHLAIITGIAWDHINVFPSFEAYVEQFALFLESVEPDGEVFYYAHDEVLQAVVANYSGSARLTAYEAPPARIRNGQTFLNIGGEELGLQIFGQHNLENLRAAALVCGALGMSEKDFYAAIRSFPGAAKRMQTLIDRSNRRAILDFAHAPSKVRATTRALRAQFPRRELIACLELHTFSSLNRDFLPQYHHSLAAAHRAIVYVDDHTLAMKQRPPIADELIHQAFDHPQLQVLRQPDQLRAVLRTLDWNQRNLLLMTSGTFGGLDLAGEVDDLFGSGG
ncbi:MAG: Mur ligase family protein [Bacteroidota bacterium]